MKYIVTIFLQISLLLIISGCSVDKTEPKKEPELTHIPQKSVDTIVFGNFIPDSNQVEVPPGFYDSWEKVYFENIKLLYQKGHPLESGMKDFAQVYKTILRRNSQVFRLPEPSDTIVILYFTGIGQGQELSHTELPTVKGDTIFYWTGNKVGITAAMHVLHRWTNIKSQYDFIYNGILRLLDASGRDYHSMTLSFVDSSTFLTFDQLLADKHINVHAEAFQSAEGASFVDYFIFKFGIDNFKLLYESQLPFNETVQTICNMNSKALENDWISVIRKAVQARK